LATRSHRQTVGAAYLTSRPAYRARHFHIDLPDGDRLVAHLDAPQIAVPSRRSVLLVHGLAGCHGSPYMRRIAEKLAEQGYAAYRLDLRGCGAGMSLARHSVHAGRIDDLESALAFVEGESRGAPLTLVGFSLGASLTLKLLGSLAHTLPNRLDSAVAVAPPLDLAACCRNLQNGLNWIYDRSFLRNLRRYLRQRRATVAEFHDVDWTKPPRSLYDFDATFTAPLGGFRDVEDYYERSSSLPDLANIRVPTRILFAEDDPLIPSEVYRRATYSSATQVFATPSGGHLGYLGDVRAVRDSDWHWMDWRVVDWVRDADQNRFLCQPA
jgi:uncharacterized protein